MTLRTLRVLFVSRRNTARSLMAEAVLDRIGKGRFEALSAGVERHDDVDPLTARLLASSGYKLTSPRPKLLTDVAPEAAASLDFIFTLCDSAHGEPLPEWVGHPISAHWSCEDPALIEGDEVGRALGYARVLAGIERRITIFAQLPFESLDRTSLQHHVDRIATDPLHH
jgi:protein-tyrosine-phosphatase